LVAVRFNCIGQILESIAPRTPMISVFSDLIHQQAAVFTFSKLFLMSLT